MISTTQRLATVPRVSRAAPVRPGHASGPVKRGIRANATGKELELAGIVFEPFRGVFRCSHSSAVKVT